MEFCAHLNWNKLNAGTCVALNMTTLTIMQILPREVDPTGVSYAEYGGGEQGGEEGQFF